AAEHLVAIEVPLEDALPVDRLDALLERGEPVEVREDVREYLERVGAADGAHRRGARRAIEARHLAEDLALVEVVGRRVDRDGAATAERLGDSSHEAEDAAEDSRRLLPGVEHGDPRADAGRVAEELRQLGVLR